MGDKEQAVVAITLLEHAAGLLTAVTREAPRLDLGPTIASLNREIHALQQKLIRIADSARGGES